jgi:16S rRNA (cytidine1402-2'-O)-methyltransferase
MTYLKKISSGNLFVVATPIGNLGDITIRAVDILKQVDLIAAEDTRHSSKLLKHYDIKTPVISLHTYNENRRSEILCNKLLEGKDIALISDAGTPLISDPGYRLIQEGIKYNLPIIPIPGACAAISALCISGLPADGFIFEGFLPAKKNQQIQRLKNLVTQERTMIFYESPHRLLQTIQNMNIVFNENRYIVLIKELTKIFESTYRGTIAEIQKLLLSDSDILRGEFVILVKGVEKTTVIDNEVTHILKILSEALPAKTATMLTSKITGINKNQLYKFLINEM